MKNVHVIIISDNKVEIKLCLINDEMISMESGDGQLLFDRGEARGIGRGWYSVHVSKLKRTWLMTSESPWITKIHIHDRYDI